jgi:hypothetical protein
MFNAIFRALLAGFQIDFALCHHRKHGIIYGQAIAAKQRATAYFDPAERNRPEIAMNRGHKVFFMIIPLLIM